MITPVVPVTITAKIVKETSPPISEESSKAIALVTDFGTNEILIISSRPKRWDNKSTEAIEVAAPTVQPTKIVTKCFFKD